MLYTYVQYFLWYKLFFLKKNQIEPHKNVRIMQLLTPIVTIYAFDMIIILMFNVVLDPHLNFFRLRHCSTCPATQKP